MQRMFFVPDMRRRIERGIVPPLFRDSIPLPKTLPDSSRSSVVPRNNSLPRQGILVEARLSRHDPARSARDAGSLTPDLVEARKQIQEL